MVQSAGDTTLIENCDELLIRSNRIYQAVFEQYQSLTKELPDSVPEQIQQRLRQIDTLYSEVKTIDEHAAELVPSFESLPESTENLLATRVKLLGNLQEINLNIVKKANKTKSLLLHEIKSMHTGRNALKGYGNVADTVKKNIVTGSF